MPWIDDDEYKYLKNHEKEEQLEARLTASSNPVDAVLSSLRDSGDPGYETARSRALEEALSKGDNAEFIRISEEHKSFTPIEGR